MIIQIAQRFGELYLEATHDLRGDAMENSRRGLQTGHDLVNGKDPFRAWVVSRCDNQLPEEGRKPCGWDKISRKRRREDCGAYGDILRQSAY